MPDIIPYDREAAVQYAHRWAYDRNPRFYNYDEIGGDCTNFASQCLYAGTGVMNYTPVYGWYYIDPNNKAPAWTGVPFFYNFLVRPEESPGPFGVNADFGMLQPGDFVQFRFRGKVFGHTPVVVEVGEPPEPNNILLAAHSEDTDFRPLSTYSYRELRLIHILGAYPQADNGAQEIQNEMSS